MLVRMGQADASGIADYFGLHKKNGLCTDKYGDWHYYEDGEVSDYTGMAVNEYLAHYPNMAGGMLQTVK